MTLDSTFLFKTASSSSIAQTPEQGANYQDYDLTNQELIETRPNSRVLRLETYNVQNKKGKPFQVFCNNNEYKLKGSKPVTLYKGVWHLLAQGSTKDDFSLHEACPAVHNFDISIEQADQEGEAAPSLPSIKETPLPKEREDETQSSDDEPKDPTDEQIRNSPLLKQPALAEQSEPDKPNPTPYPIGSSAFRKLLNVTQHTTPTKPAMSTQTQPPCYEWTNSYRAALIPKVRCRLELRVKSLLL